MQLKYCPFCNKITFNDKCDKCYGLFPIFEGTIIDEIKQYESGNIIPAMSKGFAHTIELTDDYILKLTYKQIIVN